MPRRGGLSRPQGGRVGRGPYGDANNSVTIEVDGLGRIVGLFSTPIVPASVPAALVVAASDESTNLTTGTAKVTFRMPYSMNLTEVRASLQTAQASGSIFTVDINANGVSILSTEITIDNTEKSSFTATTPPVISTSFLADDDEITVDIDQVGTAGAKGLKIALIGTTP